MNTYRLSEIPPHLREHFVPQEIGLEATPEAYVAEMVAVFADVRRVLTDDGTLWLNLGDSYANAGGVSQPHRDSSGGMQTSPGTRSQGYALAGGGFARSSSIGNGAKPKDLLGIPWRVALALQADGWYLRSDIIWSKPNPMPESVTDRPTKAHEYVFLLSKSPRYYYDAAAIAEEAKDWSKGGPGTGIEITEHYGAGNGGNAGLSAIAARYKRGDVPLTRNARTVWPIATQPYDGAHFATMPPELARRCILAGSAAGDTVLDPFAGSGTTLSVATGHGRNAIGCELNPAYAALAVDRIGPMLATLEGAA